MPEHARRQLVRIQFEQQGERHERQQASGQRRRRRPVPRREAVEQGNAEQRIDERAKHQRTFQSQQRQAEVHRDQHACDGPERIRGIDLPDRALARAAAQQRAGDKRQRHAGEKRRRQHHQRRDALAGKIKEQIAGIRARKPLHQVLHQLEAAVVDRQRGECCEGHRDLHPAEQLLGTGQAVHQAPHGEASQRQAENECREHEFEGVRGGAQHQRQHADPTDFVDERCQAREQRHHQQRVRRRRAVLGAYRRRSGGGPGKQRDRNRERQIDDARGAQCARQTDPCDQDETARQNAHSRAQAVGEIQRRDRFSACLRRAHQTRAHERKRRARAAPTAAR